MADSDTATPRRSSGALYFILGLVVAAVLVIGYVVFEGMPGADEENPGVSISVNEDGVSAEVTGTEEGGGN